MILDAQGGLVWFRPVSSPDSVSDLRVQKYKGQAVLAWWEGAVTWGSFIHRYSELGGGDVPAFAWDNSNLPPTSRLGEVDTVDGFLLGLSPWVVRNIRFDETLVLGHGFDLDFSLQLRQAGRRLMVEDLEVVHHRSIELVSDLAVWVQAHIQVAEKWDHVLHDPPADEGGWKRRARRAEAWREAARAIAMSESLKLEARVLERERRLEAMTSTVSWRLTAPLRTLNHRRRMAAARAQNPGDGARSQRRWD